jgi:mono/diheme cytochrome c family protein
MKRSACLVSLLLAVSAHAQQAAGTLNETQQLGRQVFAQSCGVCHLPLARNAKTYGPLLNRASASGTDALMRAFIVNGSDRMPSFRHYLEPAEIEAVVAYLQAVPAPDARK